MKKVCGIVSGFISFLLLCVILRSVFGADPIPASLLMQSLLVANPDFNDRKTWRREWKEMEILRQPIVTPLGTRLISYCALITYRLIRDSRVVGIAVIPVWHGDVWRDDIAPVYKIWGRQGEHSKNHILYLEGAWTRPFTGVDMRLIPKVWHAGMTSELAGFTAEIYDEKSFVIVASQFFANPEFVKKIPRPPQPSAPTILRDYRRG